MVKALLNLQSEKVCKAGALHVTTRCGPFRQMTPDPFFNTSSLIVSEDGP